MEPSFEGVREVELALRGLVDTIFGILLDAEIGFNRIIALVGEMQSRIMQTTPAATPEYLDSRRLLFGEGPPQSHRDESTLFHRVPLGDLRQRNQPGGPNR